MGVRKQVRALETDLRERSDDIDRYRDRLRGMYEEAWADNNTTVTYGAWRDERITQTAVAWVLGTVFVRFCEDNGLIDRTFIAGPGLRSAEAEERQYVRWVEHPETNDQDWLVEAFAHLARSHVALARIFDRARNPLWDLAPSPRAAAELIEFWRRRGEDGSLLVDFTQPGLDTDFLGDLYQDISETSRKAYALVRTPEFIADFVLNLTVDAAIAEFGPHGFRGIDPACGSGTFPLGLFERLLAAWRAVEPGTPAHELIRRTLDSVHGCDVNPFAVSITRFRLLMAAVRASGRRSLRELPEHVINVAVADALVAGRGAPGGSSPFLPAGWERGGDGTVEDIDEFSESCDLLGRNSYNAVISEPPFSSVREKVKSSAYRAAYDVASGAFPLHVLFAERMFQLAVRKTSRTSGGYVGQYTSSSFTRRNFGAKLIDEVFRRVALTHVIDTSGVYAPGHGTPTLILVGRNDPAMRDSPVRSVLGVRGEPKRPTDPAEGIVWKSILDQIDRPNSTSEWVTVQDEPRQRFSRFPWTLTGGGAGNLVDMLSRPPRRLADVLSGSVGVAADPGQREVFALGRPWFARHPDSAGLGLGMVTSETVRNWRAEVSTEVLAPYDGDGSPLQLDLETSWARHLWTMRQFLRSAPRARGSAEAGAGAGAGPEAWWTWRHWSRGAHRGPAITFASVAAHNRFAFEHGGRVFSRTAPVLRLSPGADEDEYIALLGVLNSSTVCFWLKQTGAATPFDGPGVASPGEEWARPYRFATGPLTRLPLPADAPIVRARELHALARLLETYEPSTVCAREQPPSRSALDAARAVQEETGRQMVSLQEELDWEVYGSYGLLADDERARLTTPADVPPPPLRRGERAFEIVLARRIEVGEDSDSWFVRHAATPITEIPQHWPSAYKNVVRARIEAIESRHPIAVVERPEYKRRWLSESWGRREREALRTWLLDRCEDERLWFERGNGDRHPRPRTIGQLAGDLGADTAVRSVAALYSFRHLGRRHATLRDVLAEILTDEHVPYVSALRYKESGLRKRAQWEQVWQLQRSEDRTGEAMGIPVPPKFSAADFRHTSYWSLRGSLDIPRERFVSYPGAVAGVDSLLIGWSGWSDTDRLLVLLDLVGVLQQQPQPGVDQVAPLLAAIQELIPWVRQWGALKEPGPNLVQAETYQRDLDDLRTDFGLSTHDLTSWRPRKATSKEN